MAISIILLSAAGSPARAAEQWNFYMHQSAPNFATSRGAKLFTEEIEKATNGELKVQTASLRHAADQRQQHHPGGGRERRPDRRRPVQFRQYPGGGHSAPADARSSPTRISPRPTRCSQPYIEKSFAAEGLDRARRLHLSAAGHVGHARSSSRSTTSRA